MDIPESAMKGGAGFSSQPIPPAAGKVRNGFPGAKKTADVDAIFLHRAESDIAVRGQMHFQILAQ